MKQFKKGDLVKITKKKEENRVTIVKILEVHGKDDYEYEVLHRMYAGRPTILPRIRDGGLSNYRFYDFDVVTENEAMVYCI